MSCSNYQGGNIQLTGDTSRIIKVSEHPDLKHQIGHDIVTTDGTTLLGADDKAGIAEIMTAAATLIANPEIRHGTIKILFTTDEEIGRGADKVDIEKLGAAFAYTLDGGTIGEIDDETFSADGVEIEITGVAQHPGTSKGVMENAIKIAADIVARLPKDMAPETTDGRQGFIHPTGISGSMDAAHLKFIIRDFVNEGLTEKEDLLKSIAEDVMKAYPGSTMRFTRHRAVPQHERGARPPSRNHGQSDRSRPPRRPRAGHQRDPRRHRRLTPLLHGPALPQHLHRRPLLPLPARMGQPPGHGEVGRNDCRAGQGLGGAGLSLNSPARGPGQ
jgi:di/tripeptidase